MAQEAHISSSNINVIDMTTACPNSSSHRYAALGPGEIRLLELYPGSGNDDLRGDLSIYRLPNRNDANRLKYQAVSYAWGEQSFTSVLYLQYGSLQIRSSLAGALRRFRNERESVLLWADAICINQGDKEEKKVQVAMMTQIYSHANEVWIWLGEAAVEDTEHFCILSTLAQHYNQCPPRKGRGPMARPDRCDRGHSEGRSDAAGSRDQQDAIGWEASGTDPASVIMEDEPQADKPMQCVQCECCGLPCRFKTITWNDACKFVQFWEKPWFTRLWVIQEAVRADRAWLHCGSHRIDFRTLRKAWHRLRAYFDAQKKLEEQYSAMFHALQSQATWGNGESKAMTAADAVVFLILETAEKRCKDPLDRLYAIRGIEHKSSDRAGHEVQFPMPPPDYCITPQALWTNFARAMLTTKELWDHVYVSFDSPAMWLVYAGEQHADQKGDLPSWAVDLEQLAARDAERWAKWRHYHMSARTIAAGGRTCDRSVPTAVGESGMRFAGLTFDTLSHVSEDTSWPGRPADWEGGITVDWVTNRFIPWISSCRRFLTARLRDLAHALHDLGAILNVLFPFHKIVEGFEKIIDMIKAMLGSTLHLTGLDDLASELAATLKEEIGMFRFHHNNKSTTLAETSGGHFCWVPASAVVGDHVCLFSGVAMPFILHPVGGDHYRLVGDAYVHGVMDGEAWPQDDTELDSSTRV